MTEQNKPTKEQEIDLIKIVEVVWANRKKFYYVWPITLVLACIIILSVPRYYRCEVTLVSETESNSTGGLASIASSFGINVGSMGKSTDALAPMLYPDLLASTSFIAGLFDIPVTTIDGEVTTTYYDHIANRERPWWFFFLALIPRSSVDYNATDADTLNLFRLNKAQEKICKVIRENIVCSVDEETNVINITVEDQDPLICAVLADSACVRLQQRITEYRTGKATIDLNYTQKIYNEAEADYFAVRQEYNRIYEANSDAVRRSALSKIEDVEKRMNIKYNIYSSLATQLQAALAKVQENTPAFTIIQDPSVPNKPAGPKRTLFVIGMLFLATAGTIFYIIFKERENILS